MNLTPGKFLWAKATEKILSTLDINVSRCEKADEVSETVNAMMGLAYKSNRATAVLLISAFNRVQKF